MSGLQISKDLELPKDAGVWTFAILAIKGAGKTYGACVLAEEMVKHSIPIIALDGLGIWWGLRVGVKGKEGLPIVVFGGQHQDLPIPLKFGKNLKIKVVDEDRLRLMVAAILEAGINAVLDTSEFSKSMQRRIVATFVLELNHLNSRYGVRHVFIEEADMWCPQRGMTGDVAVSAGAIDDLVRRGGNFNLGCTLITQRSAVLNKDVLTQANCLIVLRILHKLDKDAVKTWVESVARPKDPKIMKWFDSLRELKNGEAYVWKPENPKIFKQIRFRERETLHATREFFLSSTSKNVKMMDVGAFVEKFKEIFEPPKPAEKPPEVVKPTFYKTPQPILTVLPPESPMTSDRPDAELLVRKPLASDEIRKPGLQASDRDIVGKLLYAITKAEFDERQTAPKAVEILSHYGWLHERREVEQGLLQLCDLKFLTRRISTGNMFWYYLESDSKQRIILDLVNAV